MTNLDLGQNHEVALDLPLRAGGVWRFVGRGLISPLSLLRLPVAAIVGMEVLPAAYSYGFMHNLRSYFYSNTASFKDESVGSSHIKISKVTSKQLIGEETSFGFYKSNTNIQTPIHQRKILVLIMGNGYTTKNHLDIVHKISETTNFSLDIYGIDHPKCDGLFDFDKEKTIRNTCTHITRLLDAGYKPENMIFNGMSLGGAIAAASLDRFKCHKLKDGRDIKFGAIIAEKTFSSIGDYVIGGSKIPATYHAFAANILQHLVNFAKWDFNTVAIWNELPVAHRFAFNMDEDHVIPNSAALANKVTGGQNLSWGETETNINDHHITLNHLHASSLDSPSYLVFIERVAALDVSVKSK